MQSDGNGTPQSDPVRFVSIDSVHESTKATKVASLLAGLAYLLSNTRRALPICLGTYAAGPAWRTLAAAFDQLEPVLLCSRTQDTDSKSPAEVDSVSPGKQKQPAAKRQFAKIHTMGKICTHEGSYLQNSCEYMPSCVRKCVRGTVLLSHSLDAFSWCARDAPYPLNCPHSNCQTLLDIIPSASRISVTHPVCSDLT